MTCANAMNSTTKALLWGAIIVAAALMATGLDLSASASFGLVSRLTGAAWGSVSSGAASGAECAGGYLL